MDMMAQARPLEAIISRAWPRQQTVTLGAMAPVRQGELVMDRTAAPRQLPQPKAPELLLMLPEERGRYEGKDPATEVTGSLSYHRDLESGSCSEAVDVPVGGDDR